MIYLDYAATAPMREEAIETFVKTQKECFANPGSLHDAGYEAKKTLDRARKTIASVAGVSDEEIYFAPSATIANNAALRGLTAGFRRGRILASAYEHPSVEETLKDLEKTFEVVRIAPKDGIMQPADFLAALTDDTVLITCMLVNNETGAINDIEKLSDLLKRSGSRALLHTDAVQGFTKLPFRFSRVDAATFAGHKVGGPKGIGALYVRRGISVRPFYTGGGQEKGLFSGTENPPAAAAFACAAKLAAEEREETVRRLTEYRTYLRERLSGLGAVILSPETASSFVLSFAFPGILGENVLHFLSERGIALSTGSACSSKKPSRVIAAIGKGELSRFVLRLSMSGRTTREEVNEVIACLKEAKQSILPVK